MATAKSKKKAKKSPAKSTKAPGKSRAPKNESRAPKSKTIAKPKTKASAQVFAKMTVAELRRAWIDFFNGHNHKQVPSASLVPAGDPTLLFTTAGMVQFKPYFAGTQKPPHPRVTTIQKCLRTTDLESVGRTTRHLTFFEMLGNFSFGDYFKQGAIEMAWQFSREVLRFPQEKIFVTIYQDDDEAEQIWHKKIGVAKGHITRLGKKDNWWGPAGDSGACGPCSELYLDRGAQACTCGNANCKPADECERYLEYWNLVFNQFNQTKDGALQPLPQTGIDTGAGLERIAALLHGKDSVYDTDELGRLIAATESLTESIGTEGKQSYAGGNSAAFRVIADHARSVSFAMADGVTPDNTGRGYVMRRLIRRALMFGRELGFRQPFLHKLIPLVVELCGDFYPEVRRAAQKIEETILREEERFLHTLDQGLRRYEEYLEEHRQKKAKTFSGEAAFRLYDTFGFPLEMTTELAVAEGLSVDLQRFEELMQEQRDAGAAAARWKGFTLPQNFPTDTPATKFIGYSQHSASAALVGMIANESSVEELANGPGIIVLDQTCFYAEGGGQLGDTGRIIANDAIFRVNDTRKVGELYLHIGEVISGSFVRGQRVEAEIDSARRDDLMRHHSATHLLNAALRSVLGDHIVQTGSLVAPEYLRFDFSHGARLSPEEIQKVEGLVNEAIARNAPVLTEELPIEEARQRGAVATFGEKYGEQVRVVSMGKSGELSIEFCGGTHVPETGFIGAFHILREGSPGAGNRRIEAVTGAHSATYFRGTFDEISSRVAEHNSKAQAQLKANNADEPTRQTLLLPEAPQAEEIERLIGQGAQGVDRLNEILASWNALIGQKEKDLARFEKQHRAQASGDLLAEVDELLSGGSTIGETLVVKAVFDEVDIAALRKLGDSLKEKHRNLVVLLGNRTAKGPVLLFMANAGAVQDGADCGRLIREAAALVGGGGGGKPETAQAGGKDNAALEAALQTAFDSVRVLLKK